MRFKTYLQEAKNCLQITDLDWYGLPARPLMMPSDLPETLSVLDERWPGLELEVTKWDGPNDVPLVTLWGPPKQMEKFFLFYANYDEDDADDLLAMCEKVVK